MPCERKVRRRGPDSGWTRRTGWTRGPRWPDEPEGNRTALTFVPMEGSLTDTLGWLFGTSRYQDWITRRSSNGATVRLTDSQTVAYLCVPDTWDGPSGPKGK